MYSEIRTNYNNIQFTSKLNPIKPFSLKTSMGKIRIYEPTEKEIKKPNFIENVVDMWCRNFATYTKDPGWLRYNNPEYADEFNQLKKMFCRDMRHQLKIDDGHTTLLVAKNDKNEICGACFTYSYDEVPAAHNTTMYLDSIAVDELYRGNGIAKEMLNKAINADKAHFTDIFAVVEKLARGFYNSLGFKPLKSGHKNQRDLIDFIMNDREDYPKYVLFMTKPLQPEKTRWYNIAAPSIRKIYDFSNT